MKLIFKGVVQGVGFRPTIYRVAIRLGLKGYVLNTGSEVEVVVDRDIDRFIDELKKELPHIAHITAIIKEPDKRTFSDFRILHSKKGEKKSQIPPDIATCDDCRAEMFDPGIGGTCFRSRTARCAAQGSASSPTSRMTVNAPP